MTALAHRLVHDDGAGDRYVQRGHLPGHGDAQEMVAGLFDEVVQARALAPKDEDAVGFEVEVGVVGGPALVEADDPDVLLLHLLQRADEVGDAGDADVLGGSGGGLGDGRGDGSGAALGQDDAVDTGTVGGAEERAEVVRVFDAVESEEEFVLAWLFGGQQVFDGEELPLAHHREDALMGIGAGEPGELVAGFERDADAGRAAELDQPLQTLVPTLPGDADVVELARTGTDGLLDRVETVKNFHLSSLPPGRRRKWREGFRIWTETPISARKSSALQFLRKFSTFMDYPRPKRVFSRRGAVSSTVQTLAIPVSAAVAAQIQSENAAIAHGLKQQDPELLDQLIELYQHRLLRYLLFLTGKREVAEDLFQETWMRVLLRGSQYNGKARFDTWLFTIARNLVIDLSRKRTMASLDEMSEGGEDDRPFEIAMAGPSPLEQFQSRENCAEVSEVLLKLDPPYREVLVLRFYEELSLDEIASVTRAPLSTVKSRLYRGLAALKPEMEQLRASRPFMEAGA